MARDHDRSHARQATRLAARMGRGHSALGMLCGMRRGARCPWALKDGVNLLVRWTGERDDVPDLHAVPPERDVQFVGLAIAGATAIQSWSHVTHEATQVYHFALACAAGGGEFAELVAAECQVIVTSAAGLPTAVMPNTPRDVQVRRTSDNKPLVSWIFNRVREQVTPTGFHVFARDDDTDFDWETPIGTVAHVDGQTRYWWAGDTALSAGDVRYYTVRAYVGGVMSLVPRSGQAPSVEVNSVGKGRWPMLRIPATPPAAPEAIYAEVRP